MKCWGDNRKGQLGDNTTANKNTPTGLKDTDDNETLTSGVTAVSAGGSHTCAIYNSGGITGILKCWGDNEHGQLGNNDSGSGKYKKVPTQVSDLNSGVTAVSAGAWHTCAIYDSGGTTGILKCWGDNASGQLGDNTILAKNTPTGLKDAGGTNPALASGVTAVSAGDAHTCAIQSGALKCWGSNGNGRLGIGDDDTVTAHKTTPTQVIASGVRAVSAGHGHTCAVHNGALKCWGSSSNFRLGLAWQAVLTWDQLTHQNTPQEVLATGVTAVSAGSNGVCAVHDGAFKCWGRNAEGQIGDGTTNTPRKSPTPVAIYPYTCPNGEPADVDSGGTADPNTANHVNCASCTKTGFTARNRIAGTNRYTCEAVQTYDYTCTNGNPDPGTTTSSGASERVNCNECTDANYMTLSPILGSDGVTPTGRNDCTATTYPYTCPTGGVAADGTTTDSTTANHVNCGSCNPGYTAEQIGGTGRYECLQLHAYTCPSSGTADPGTTTDSNMANHVNCGSCNADYERTQILTTGRYSCLATYTCDNGDATSGTPTGASPIVDCADCDPGYEETDILIAPLGRHSCKPIYTCANGDANTATITGTTTLEDCTDCDPGYEETDILIAPLGRHSCKPIYTCANGDANTAAITGTTTLEDCTDCDPGYEETDILIAPLGRHSCEPTYTCANGVGKSGTPTGGTPVADCASCDSGYTKVEITGTEPVRYECQPRIISAGGEHTCAIHDNGVLKCWGRNNYGQLGDGTYNTIVTPKQILASRVKSVSAGRDYTCAVLNTGAVQCWGRNLHGQLGDNSKNTRRVPVQVVDLTNGVRTVSSGAAHTCAIIDSTGALKCWGWDGEGEVGDTKVHGGNEALVPHQVTGLTSGVRSVSTGDWHTCAIDSAGALKCWGYNTNGQVGDNTVTIEGSLDENKRVPVQVSGLTSGVTAVSAGGSHTCAIDSAGALKCWGRNVEGQLGDDSTTQSSIPVQVSGLTSG